MTLPSFEEKVRAQIAAQAALLLREREQRIRWRTDPWQWYMDRVNLLDPLAPPGQQIAPFPDFGYLRAVVHALHTSNAVLGWKSRRMIFSWTGIAWAVYLCSVFENQRCFFITRKEGESDGEGCRELIWRTKWMLDHLRGDAKVVYEGGTLIIKFPDTGSQITAMSSHPDAARSIAANFIMGDELGFWEKPRETFQALKPTLEQRGKFFGISSAAEGFFKELVLDIPDAGGDPPPGHPFVIPGRGVVAPQNLVIGNRAETSDDGLEVDVAESGLVSQAAIAPEPFAVWNNPGNGFTIVAAHYTADPRKNTPEWLEREMKGITRSAWLQEYEMQFNVHQGRPVYANEWAPSLMLRKRVTVERQRPIWVSLDFGYHHPAMVCGQMKNGLQMAVMRSFQGSAVQFDFFMYQVISLLKEWFPKRDLNPNARDFIWCCDKSGLQKQSLTGENEIRILKQQFGIHAKWKAHNIEAGLDIVRGFMSRTYKGEPCFVVDDHPSNGLLIKAFEGGYSYPSEQKGKLHKDEPVKDNVHDHVMDCVRIAAVCFGPSRFDSRELIKHSRSQMIGERRYSL